MMRPSPTSTLFPYTTLFRSAKFEIYQLIHQLADRGAGVLVISSEIEELIGICDLILVLRHGKISGEFRREEFDREKILAADRKSTRLNSSHSQISYAVFCLK